MILPKEIILSRNKNPKTILLYGTWKVGKTESAAELTRMKNALIVDLEDSADFFDSRFIKIKDLNELKIFCNTLAEENKKLNSYYYDYLIIDTISTLEEWCEKDAQRMYLESSLRDKSFTEKDDILSLPHGSGYGWLRKAFGRMITILSSLTPNIIFIGHIREKEIVDEKGNVKSLVGVNSVYLNLTGKIRAIMASKVDAIGFMYRGNQKDEKGNLVFDEFNKLVTIKMITFNSANDIICGTRCEHLKGKTFPFDWDKIFIEGE